MNAAIKAMANLLAQEVDPDKRKKELFVSQNKKKVTGENSVFFGFFS